MDTPLSSAVVGGHTNSVVVRKWGEHWLDVTQRQKVCRQTNIFLPIVERGHSKWILGLDRLEIKMLVGSITGHAGVKYHLSKMRRYEGCLLCRFCAEEVEEANHLILRCPVFYHHRRSIFQTDHPLELATIKGGRKSFLEKLLKYIKHPSLKKIFVGEEQI